MGRTRVNMDEKKKNQVRGYNIGLDIGTNSVGWAVTDTATGELLEFKHKKMLGSRLFEAGESAAATRQKRGMRRRYHRRKERINLLKMLMEDMVLKNDKNFFRRMDEGFLHIEDKKIKLPYILFNDPDYTDQNYYHDENTRTIYHLRKTLCNTTEKMDARLIYLALHNLIKYRGHFLYQGQKFSEVNNKTEKLFEDLYIQLSEKCDFDNIQFDLVKIQDVVEVLKDCKISKKEKQEKTLNIIAGTMDKNLLAEVIKLIIGYKANFAIIFNDGTLIDDAGKKIKLSFSDSEYEKNEDKLLEQLDEKAIVLELLKKINSWLVLQEVLQGEATVAEAMVNKYEKHRRDLAILKKYMKENLSTEDYTWFFRKEVDKNGNYLKNYVNYIAGDERCSQKKLYDTLDRFIQEDESKEAKFIQKEIKEENFLLCLNTKKNASVPYQLTYLEAEKIINNQLLYYPQLKENKDKILSLITFRIPYYVGPMNSGSRFSWIERRTNEKIYPWNLEQVVDVDKTAEKFIKRMTNKCTYLVNEDVIPRYSLLYNEYVLLNELNKIRINGKLIAPKDKEIIIAGLFCKKKTVKEDSFVNFLKSINYQNAKEYKIEGYQKEKEFSASLNSYIDFQKIFGEINASNREMIEKIIYWLTVFEEKEIVKRKISQKYGEQVSDKQMNFICRLRYKGWSRLSKKLINGIRIYNVASEGKTVIDIMRETNENFMQVINNKRYGFSKLINDENQNEYKEKIMIEDVMELQGSPAIKRGIWQTTQIVDELISIMGREPENIFLEFAREEQNKKRSTSRENILKKCYEKLRKNVEEYNKEIEQNLKNSKYVKKLDREKMLLYFMQNGKCMYTGVPLDIDKLEMYQIDHILPQAYIKDDSIENKALVTIDANQIKTDNLLLDENIKKKQYLYWTNLYDCNLIGAKKYRNLLRETIGENETKGFINRQLVETRQITKHVMGLFAATYTNSNIVSIRADLSHNFREKYKLYKSRQINNYHHAHDAFLAATIGGFLLKTFPDMENELIYDKFMEYRRKNKKSVLLKSKYGYILSLFDQDIVSEDGEIIWRPEYIENIREVIDGKYCLVTRKMEEQTGAFYKKTIYGAKNKKASIPLKKNMSVEKYGGYTGKIIAYMDAVLYKEKKKEVKKLIGIPCYVVTLEKTCPGSVSEYIQKELKVSEYTILKDHIKKYQKIIENGNELYLTSYEEVINAKEFYYNCNSEERKTARNIFMKCLSGHCKKNEEDTEDVKKALEYTFNYMILKSKGQYQLYADIFEKIDQAVDFVQLSYEEKMNCLKEMLKLTSATAARANMKKFSSKDVKLSEQMGRKNRHTVDLEHTTFIDQSITGLYERKYCL